MCTGGECDVVWRMCCLHLYTLTWQQSVQVQQQVMGLKQSSFPSLGKQLFLTFRWCTDNVAGLLYHMGVCMCDVRYLYTFFFS